MNISRRALFLIAVTVIYFAGCVVAFFMDRLNMFVSCGPMAYCVVLSVPMWFKPLGRSLNMAV